MTLEAMPSQGLLTRQSWLAQSAETLHDTAHALQAAGIWGNSLST